MALSAGGVGGGTPGVEGFGRGETTAPCTAGVGDEGLPAAVGLGVCDAGFEETAGIAVDGGGRDSAG